MIEEAVEIASRGTDGIYVTVDIDSIDSALATGTGMIDCGGPTPVQLEAMGILKDAKTVGFDLTEVAPDIDPTGVTEILAAQAIFNFLSNRIFA